MDADVRKLLERGVVALEKLSEDPVIQMETGPPACPHCERVNPHVRVRESESNGLMAEIVERFECVHCRNVFYGIPLQWANVRSVEEAEIMVRERADAGGYGD